MAARDVRCLDRRATLCVPALALLLVSHGLSAQLAPRQDPDPDMPVKDGFDTDRAIFWAHPNFVPLRDPEVRPLRTAMRSGEVGDDTPVVVLEVAGQSLVLISSQMAYHHVAQGELEGEPWMVTF